MSTILLAGLGFIVLASEKEIKIVPLDSVYGTTGQKEIKSISTAKDAAGKFEDPAGADLHEIMQLHKKTENFFLVNGKDIAAAVKASVGGFAKEPPAVTEKESVWLSVYFGVNGSSPPAFVVERVEISGKTIRLSYRKGLAVSADIHQYLVFVPLGKLAAGEYTVELYETKSQETTAKKKVKVAEK